MDIYESCGKAILRASENGLDQLEIKKVLDSAINQSLKMITYTDMLMERKILSGKN